MAFQNRMTQIMNKLDRLPVGLRFRALSFAFGRIVPYVATSGVRIVSLTQERAEAVIRNQRRVRNHVGGVHAAAVALLAETTSGLIVARNVNDGALPLIKSMTLRFVKRNQGSFHAVAELDPEQVQALQTASKGQTIVRVTLTDETGTEPVTCEMHWAWVPKPSA